jgi:hypothetical protein
MLAMPSVKDRVRLWNFMAVKEHREKLDLIHREQTTQSIKEFQQTQVCYISYFLILINLGRNLRKRWNGIRKRSISINLESACSR